MSTKTDKITEDALSLPVDSRLSLVEKLIASLNLPVDEEIEKLWAEEAERRIEDIDAGKTKLIPGDKVFAKIRKKYSDS